MGGEKFFLHGLFDLFDGITPAWAGKRKKRGSPGNLAKDHPRIGGEKFGAYAKIWNEWGSPPRRRGKEDFTW
ncbi:hypothetical protein CRH10_06510 [Faecalibacterium prausnitzii]|uniref:Uncharacterized protein n=1 Tax=Faecalibacterium prausnitzii TaxID=853 RepID=A0A291TA14_9FIRM|nr:hypothetical protein CRH10_06510 [Faecalibacterium prausnitzii]